MSCVLSFFPECMYCGPSSIQQLSKVKQHAPCDNTSPMVLYCKCNNYMCITCIDGFIEYISKKTSIIQGVQKDDVSYKSLCLMSWMVREKSFFKVSVGPCCTFTESFSADEHPQSTVKPFWPPPIITSLCSTKMASSENSSSPVGSDEGIDDDDPPWAPRKEDLRHLRNHMTRVQSDEMSSNSLHDYHKSATKCTINGDLTLKHRPKDILAHVNRKRGRRARKKSRLNPTVSPLQTDHNIFQGVLVMPMFGIGIQGDSTCDHWYPDHMAPISLMLLFQTEMSTEIKGICLVF